MEAGVWFGPVPGVALLSPTGGCSDACEEQHAKRQSAGELHQLDKGARDPAQKALSVG